jgi:protein disulfide-isomerase
MLGGGSPIPDERKKQTMKKTLIATVAALAVFTATAGEWLTDLPKAQAQAKKENKLVLLDFTGSDWCGWCIKLNKEVFNTPDFKAYAAKSLVLVEVDFPQKKEQSAEQKKANRALQEKYGIEGYPTLIVLDGDGKQVGKLGYMKGGPKPFIAELQKLKK